MKVLVSKALLIALIVPLMAFLFNSFLDGYATAKDLSRIETEMKNGLLTIRTPLKDSEKPIIEEIKIS